jgi:D-glycero-alpha-D-manno-heptose-7-phosphate kinase
MIIARSPLRISLGGGGTDLPSYYQKHGGFLIAAAIDKYVYITIHETFGDEMIIKYSQIERVTSAKDLSLELPRPILKSPAWPIFPPALVLVHPVVSRPRC